MKSFTWIIIAALLVCCNDPDNSAAAGNKQLQKQNDSLANIVAPGRKDSNTVATTAPVIDTTGKAGVHPISLQWISWDKKGEAGINPLGDGWYSIKGEQVNAEKDRLTIEGKIRRLSEKELEFEGVIETAVSYNNGGQPCVKNGRQVFVAKGKRTYYRLQNMNNCEGNRVVDYVDIYPGTSSL